MDYKITIEELDRIVLSLLNDFLVMEKLDSYGITYIEDQREFYVFKDTMYGDNVNLMFIPYDKDSYGMKDYSEVFKETISFINFKEEQIKGIHFKGIEVHKNVLNWITLELNKYDKIRENYNEKTNSI